MLAFILAIAVGLASVFFFLSAFFAPKLHRKDDFLWSGVGFFYALVLWLCATRITGGVLLGQGAAVVLILSFTWQTIKLRAALVNSEAIAPNSDFSLLDWVGGGLSRKKAPVKTAKTSSTKVPTPQPEVTSTIEETVIESAKSVVNETKEAIADQVAQTEELVEEVQEIVAATSPSEIIETVTQTISKTDIAPEETSPIVEKSSIASKSKKPGFFSGLFSKKTATPKTSIPKATSTNSNLVAALDAVEVEEEMDDWDETEEVNQPELVVESVTVEMVETITEPEQTEDQLDDLLEEDPLEETETVVNSESATTEPEVVTVTSISGLSDMLDTYDQDMNEFDPYLGGQETTTALESNLSPSLSTSDQDGTAETSAPEVSVD